MKLSVVIVNYNVKNYVEQCLLSLHKALEGIEAEVLLVDNHSVDGSVEYLREHFDWVRIVASRHNLGFARANNLAIRMSQGEYVLLLNPDTIVAEPTLREALAWMDGHADAGSLGVRMLNASGESARESRRGVPTPMVAFWKMIGLCDRMPAHHHFGHYYMGYLDWNTPAAIEVVSGAFCMLRREALDKVGLLDEDFFMYGEDIDLSYRIVKAGYSNYYIPSPIIHYKGESTQKNSYRYVKVFYEAMQIFFRKHYPHYSLVYGAVIRFAISLRSWMGLAHRFVDRLLPKKQPEVEYYDYVEAVTDEYLEIRNALKVPYDEYCIVRDLSTHRFFSSRVFVVFDNRKCSYSETIKAIYRFSRRNMDFATYLSESKVMITPKM